MDDVERRFAEIVWHYGDKDDRARAELTRKIAGVGRSRTTITYSDLVNGVTFQVPNVYGGHPFQIGVGGDWTDLDRALLGDFLGYISMLSYREGRFIASALVVSKSSREPSEGFRSLMRQLGLLKSGKRDDFMLLWSDELNKAYEWYERHPT